MAIATAEPDISKSVARSLSLDVSQAWGKRHPNLRIMMPTVTLTKHASTYTTIMAARFTLSPPASQTRSRD